MQFSLRIHDEARNIRAAAVQSGQLNSAAVPYALLYDGARGRIEVNVTCDGVPETLGYIEGLFQICRDPELIRYHGENWPLWH